MVKKKFLKADSLNEKSCSIEFNESAFRKRSPHIILIENRKNLGFSRANNQAIRQATGEYILLLNPDTVVEEDTLKKCCEFMDKHSDAGALGVKMLDGNGNFLPESKRGLPTPIVAFYKIFGLAKLFPTSKTFGKYHLGYLDKDQTHEVDVLSGAFFMVRKKVLDKTGPLDEDYFMYGEDIDLSYRILKAGYKNYYFADTRIIHYKGKSTSKTSVNYVSMFYKAMIIFANKHFTGKKAKIFSLLINLAIYIRAGLAVLSRFIRKSILPFADISIIYIGMYFLKTYWENNHKWVPGKYPPEFLLVAVPGYIFFWLISVYLSGGYDKPVRSSKIVLGIIIGTISISAVTNFVDQYRFSKALILLGAAWSTFSLIGLRLLLHFISYRNFNIGSEREKRIIIVGNHKESERVIKILQQSKINSQLIGYVSANGMDKKTELHLGELAQIKEIIQIYNVDEIIFCSKDIPANQIIEWMTKIDNKFIDYKIVPDESNFIIGSGAKQSQIDFYTINIELGIFQKSNIRNKRILDLVLSLVFSLFSPILMWFTKNPAGFLINNILIFTGKFSLVGFSGNGQSDLPNIKKGILNPSIIYNGNKLDEKTKKRLDLLYAKDYRVTTDMDLIYKGFKYLGDR